MRHLRDEGHQKRTRPLVLLLFARGRRRAGWSTERKGTDVLGTTPVALLVCSVTRGVDVLEHAMKRVQAL